MLGCDRRRQARNPLLYPNGWRRKAASPSSSTRSRTFFSKVEPLDTITRVAPGPSTTSSKAMAYARQFTYSTSPASLSHRAPRPRDGSSPSAARRRRLMAQPGVHLRPAAPRPPTWRASSWCAGDGTGRLHQVVGDAGVTVAKAVAAGHDRQHLQRLRALWAAARVPPGSAAARADEARDAQGRTMVVGATGAIGSVCARLLALAERRDLWSPGDGEAAASRTRSRKPPRHRPRGGHPDDHLGDMDLIVTATRAPASGCSTSCEVKPVA